jgi:uncharacterized membrane protein YhhN
MAQLPEALADSAADAGSLDKQQCCYKQTNPSSRIAFSLAGDVLLMNDSVSNYFISGLACFLLAHICYIWLFLSIAPQAFSSVLKRPSYFIIVMVYALSLLVVLWPKLEDLRLPVAVYAGVISVMLLAAIAVAHQLKGITGKWILSGAILFVISDSLLALNNTDWTNNIVQYRLSPHCTICLIPSAFTPESIRDKIYKILAYYIDHIGINSCNRLLMREF